MPFVSGLVHDVFILRWAEVQSGDCSALLQRVQDAKSRTPGALVYVTVGDARERSA